MRRFVVVLVAFAGLSACDTGSGSPVTHAGLTDPTVDYVARYADEVPTLDAQLNAVSLANPGFKGIIGSDDGTQIIVLTDHSEAQARGGTAGGALTSDIARRLGIEPQRLTLAEPSTVQARGNALPVAGRPDFNVLYEAKTGLRRFLFETNLVNHLDIDEATGRVVIGTASSADAEQVRASMTPDELAVTDFALTQPFRITAAHDEQTLESSGASATHANRSLRTGTFRPLIAGARTAAKTQSGTQGIICTQGPAVKYGPSGIYGFLTNSHCTLDRNNVTNIRFFQPEAVLSNFLGHEIAEPQYRKILGGAWTTSGFYADVAFVQTQQGVQLRGQMTSADNCLQGSTDCVENGFISDITGSISYLTVNTPVFKTGQITGTTYGSISHTCSDLNDLTGVRHLCQSEVGRMPGSSTFQPLAYLGDSGSPVLFQSGLLGNPQGLLAGILWGVNDLTGEFAFSPWENIWQQERAGTKYGLQVQVITSAQGLVSNTVQISPGTPLPTPPPPGGGDSGGGDPPGCGPDPGPGGGWVPTGVPEPC